MTPAFRFGGENIIIHGVAPQWNALKEKRKKNIF